MPGMQNSSEPKPYDKVITKEAKTKRGVFTVHQIKEKWYFEIPKTELNKDFLWVSQFSRAPQGVDRGGQLNGRVVRWERHENKILLKEVKYGMVADPSEPIAKAVSASNNDEILMAFSVEAWGKDEAAVIDVTRLYATDGELGPHRGTVDATRSFVDRITTYPANIEAEATYTYSGGGTAMGGGRTPMPAPSPAMGGARQSGGTFLVHYSMVKLPETPMMPRVRDDRVGFFAVNQMDYGREEQKVERRTYIARWRLEKKDPGAALSEPVKPIVYYIDPATPKKWVPYIKRAVNSWQVAFEQAGFKNAILAKEAPTPQEDPEWNTEDVRYTIIRWLPSETQNAMGPHISDPRSGEILNGNISVYHNIMDLVRSWYFLQVGPLDPRAQKFPLPDDLMGNLLEYVVKHEVGHTLGLQHNMKASSMYPEEKVRDREWVKKMGHTPSIMDYARFNYVAQPEDKIDIADLTPNIGPYDKWAIHWGYAPIPEARTPDQEKVTLDMWAREQEKVPWLRFADDMAAMAGADPGEETEAVGDADAVKATTMGLKNLERVSNLLLPATTTEKGEPYEDLEVMYGRLLGQWSREMSHVVRIVGGIYTDNKHVGQDGVIYSPVSKERQVAAVRFLNQNAFQTPSFLLKPDILRRIEPTGSIDRIAKAQGDILRGLLNPQRIARLQEVATLDSKNAYVPLEFLADVHKGVWSELNGPGPVKIDVYRRNLERTYVEYLGTQLNRATAAPMMPTSPESPRMGQGSSSSNEDVHTLFRGELRAISAAVAQAMPRAGDPMTRMHLESIKDQIAKALDPKFAPPAPATGNVLRTGFDSSHSSSIWNTCWPDYQIK